MFEEKGTKLNTQKMDSKGIWLFTMMVEICFKTLLLLLIYFLFIDLAKVSYPGIY